MADKSKHQSFVVHLVTAEGIHAVEAMPYDSFDKALDAIRRLHQQGLIKSAKIAAYPNDVFTDWPTITKMLK